MNRLRQVRKHKTAAKYGVLDLTKNVNLWIAGIKLPSLRIVAAKRLFKLQSAELVHQKRAKTL